MDHGSMPYLLQLPQEILQDIASRLSTREWARIAGSCQRLHSIQPKAVTIITAPKVMTRAIPGYIPSALEWTANHLEEARLLELTLHPSKANDVSKWRDLCKDLPATLPTLAFKGTLVTDVKFYRRMQARKTRQYDEHVRLGEDYYPVNDLEELPACLAGHMPNLQTLSLYVSYCPVLPALQHLVHLEVRAIRLYNVNSNMQQMPNLQTALISCEHMETLVGALELSGHSNLKHLSLHNHYPTNLSIPKDCRLDVHGEAHTMQQLLEKKWASVLPQLHACTCAWTNTRKKRNGIEVDSLPEVLLKQTSIQQLSLLGRGSVLFTLHPAYGNFHIGMMANLTSLQVKTEETAKLFIPAGMQLQTFELLAPMLCLDIEDRKRWGHKLEHMRIMAQVIYLGRDEEYGPEAVLIAQRAPAMLRDSVEAFGKGVSLEELRDPLRRGDVCEGHEDVDAVHCLLIRGCRFDNGWSMKAYTNGRGEPCSCGICWSCLL